MRRTIKLLSIVAVLPAVHGLRFEGPAPTDISPDRAIDVSIPEPTQGPLVDELKKRQTNLNPATCGWVDGDYSSGVTCRAGRTCMLYTSSSVGMAGCCAGSDTELCGWSNRCVDYSAYAAGNCGANCQANDFVRKCTDASQPYCVTWTYPGDRVADYGCAATSTNTIWTVLQRATDGVGGSTTMSLPTLSAGAVTGFNGATSATTRYAAPTTDSSFDGGSSSSGSGSRSRKHTAKRIAVGVIIGIVVAVLALIFFIVVGICICVKKKKKQRQLAKDAQTIAAMQAGRPQSMYPPPQQQPMQQQGPAPPIQQQGGYMPVPAPQSPQPTLNGYFPPPPGPDEHKYNPHTSVHEYATSPISNPTSPAPGYVQPGRHEFAASPAELNQQTTYAHYQNPTEGAFEADSVGVSQSPPPPQLAVSPIGQHHQDPVLGSQAHEVDAMSRPQVPATGRPVYEMGDGR